ncbi:MAG: TM2 domain-containing protein [Myxococcota bacterium]
MGLSYILCAMGLVSPVAGLHRFYLGRPLSGLLYLMTWGFFGIGTLMDLMQMPALVQQSNAVEQLQRELFSSWFPSRQPSSTAQPSIDQRILRVAAQNSGTVTVQMVALATGLSLHEAEQELDRLLKEGFCTVDFSDDGCMIYTFQGLVEQAHSPTRVAQPHVTTKARWS